MQLNYYIIINFIAGILATVLAIVVWKKRHITSSKELFLLLLSIAWWDFGIAIEYMFTDIPNRVLWSSITYPGTTATSVFYFLFIIKYTQQHITISKKIKGALFIIPAISCLIVWHPKSRLLLWPDVTLQQTSIGIVALYKHGLWFWIQMIYFYILILGGVFILIRNLFVISEFYKPQTKIFLFGSIIPLFSSLFYSYDANLLKGVDLTSIGITLTCLLLTLSIFNYKILDIRPIARNLVVDQMTDGVFVIDRNNIIVDVNPIAFKYIYSEYNDLPIGKSIFEVFKKWPALINSLKTETRIQIVIKATELPEIYYNIQITPLTDIKKNILGHSIVFRDITLLKKKEEETIRINQQLLKTIELRDKLFKIIAHDIKNPLSNLMLLSDIIDKNGAFWNAFQ
jgi:hypothetical protein